MFNDSTFAEFLTNPRIKREWDNLSNGVKHREQEDEAVRVTAQVFTVDSMGTVNPMEFCHD
ncbi:hypothetical protein pEaSNUABM11_00084 [Erwinia phage pEa_SNUABM_11]|nr:hypothetical protein pEaSNUABM11_00084 [Erwinia phage pEa_SNUABM_11]